MLDAILGLLTLSGIAATNAMADTRGAAHALARHAGALTIVPPGTARDALAPLPLAALRLAPATVAGLGDMGFQTVGDLMAVPRAPLTRRFGPEVTRRLDQALGQSCEPIDPLRPIDLATSRRAFAEPIAAAETIARQIGHLVRDLCRQLESRGMGARRLDLICWRMDRAAQAVRVGLAAPQRDPARLMRLLADKIPTIDPGFGIEIMSLTATLAEPLAPRQTARLLEPEAPDVTGLIDVLANRVGAAAVFRLAPVASEVPERSVTRVPPLCAVSDNWPDHWPRPARLLPRPEPIETMALLPDQPPHWISWRGIRHRVIRGDGPERIFGEWWKREAETRAVRDYFRIEDETGRRFWIFRQGDGQDASTGSHRWFLHGIFG
ncbi:MAG: DNA polymerase Y family protein, partial [Paracoccus sp. (in: a-proteobacteria)]|nr:DNA polymerase Y family protein [Paracoccus sp. (in: a-proteobacteria)]